MNVEIAAVWAAIVTYALSAAAMIAGTFLVKPKITTWGVILASVGLASNAVTIIARWVSSGRLPAIGYYEVAIKLAFFAVLGYLLLQWRFPGLRMAGVMAMPLAFLMLGATLLTDREAETVMGSLASFWLPIHVLFAQLAFGFYIAGFLLAAVYLLRESRYADRLRPLFARLPAQVELDSLMFKVVGTGFVFQGVMLASGAVWANEAWGSYWSWDPIETWALVAWLVYAIYLHLALTMGWRGRKGAWVVVLALPVILFSIIGVPNVFNSIHGAYLKL